VTTSPTPLDELLATLTLDHLGGGPFGTVLADPPWRFMNRTGKVAPEHKRLSRYDTMTWKEIADMPVGDVMADKSHCYLWVPNALVAEGLRVLEAWGFTYKTMLIWHKVRKDGGSDGRGVGFYYRNVTEPVLFGVRGKLRTLPPGRRQVNLLATQKREHSRKPDELYPIIESCSPGPFLELFARYPQEGWVAWGNEADPETVPRGRQYAAYGGSGLRDADGEVLRTNGNGKTPRVNGTKLTALAAAQRSDSKAAGGNGKTSTRRVRGATR
jgi:N6-adenosine-specific RNA methylase IME4